MKKLADFISLYPNLEKLTPNQLKEYFRKRKTLTPEERFLLFIFYNSRYGIVYDSWKGKKINENKK